MRIHPAGITIVADMGPAGVGKLNVGTGDFALIREISTINRVDLDGLLTRIDEMDIVDESVARL